MKMQFKIIIGLFVFFNWSLVAKAQVTIATGLPGCLPVVSQVGMGCNGGTTFFGVNASNQFQVQNVDGITCCVPFGGGDGESYFEFATLDISNYSNINISLAYSAAATGYEDDSPAAPVFGCQGTNPPDNSHDQIIFTYSIDGGAEIQSLYAHGTSAADFTGTWMAGPINGNTLTIKIYAANKATAEIFYFQNLLVTGTLLLSAGPDKTGCVGEPVNLSGAGVGTWSGGTGVFGDVTSPTTDYTPSMGEINTNVTLTFTGTPAYVGCPSPSDQMVINVNQNQNASFNIANFCAPTSGAATGIVTPGGTFSFDPPPGDGATINPANGVISNAIGGTVYSVKYTTPGPCPAEQIINVTANPGPVGTLSGNATLCPGECATFSFSFTSGNEPFTINLNASPPGIGLPAIPGVTASQVFTICYSGTGLFPTIDLATFTITIPTIFSGSGTLNLTGISDGSGCPGTASGGFALTLTSAPTATGAGPLNACADINGNGTFDLTTLNNTIRGGNGSLTVNWYEDAAGTIPVTNPAAYISAGGTVYASVSNANCESATVPVILNVDTGVVPFNSMFCAESGLDNCTICLTGNMIELGFDFGNANSYTVTVRDNSTLSQYVGVVSNGINLSVPISNSTVFQLLSIQPLTGCPNFATYSDLVTVTIVAAPDLDPISIAPACQSVTLPPITGTNLSGGQMYYSGPGGTGTTYNPGDMIFSGVTLYIYDENAGCMDEEQLVITINPLITINEIDDITACVSTVLPAITGSGLSGNTVYNTNPLGTGVNYVPGSTITQSITLYVFDPNADPNCVGNTVDVVVTINPLPAVPSITSISCSGSTGAVTVLNPTGIDFQFQLDGQSFQSSPVFTGIANGSHTIVVQNITSTCQNSIQFSVNCDCQTPATISLPSNSGSICAGDSIFVNNINFGGAATQVNLTSSGTGSFSATSFTSSPFGFTYVPSTNDIGKVINIVLTTNDPDAGGPCAPETAVFALTVRSNPIGSISGAAVVCKGADLMLTASGGLTYIWSDAGGTTSTATFNNITRQDTFYVYLTDAFGCKDTVEHLVNISQITAGRDTLISFCKSSSIIVNLNGYLTFGTTPGGIWKNGIDTIFNFGAFPITDLPLGFTNLRYIIDDIICGKDTAIVRVDIRSVNNAGIDNQFIVCQGIPNNLDFDTALGNHDLGGTWAVVTQGANLNLTNISNVNTSGLLPGSYLVRYLIPNNGCNADTALINVIVRPYVSAGIDVASSLCLGANIDLLSLVASSDKTGSIFNKNNHAGLTGTIWNTTGLMQGNFVFYYIIPNQFPCSPDTATIDIRLQQSLNPGVDQIASFCEGETLDLSSYLGTNADPGGIFYYQNQPLPNSIFTPPAVGVDFIFTYEVGDGVLCPKSRAIITLKKIVKPTVNLIGLADICEGSCTTLSLNQTGGTLTQAYITATSGPSGNTFKQTLGNPTTSGVFEFDICTVSSTPYSFNNWPPGKTISLTLDSIVILSGIGCVFDYSENWNVKTLPFLQKSVSPLLCKSASITIGTETFSITRPNGIVRKPALGGLTCDTLINVNLSFYPDATGSYNATFCDQTTSVNIGNEIFNFARPSGVAVLSGASVHGCDSTVQVLLKWEKTVSDGSYSYTTCNDNYTYTLNGETFNKSRPSGKVLLEGAAAKGCDSLVNVQLNFSTFSIVETLDYKCDGSAPQLLLNLASHIGPYTISIDGNTIGQPFQLPFTSNIMPGNHVVVVTSSEGCTQTFNIDVLDNKGPDVVLTQVPNPDGTVQIITTAPQNVIYDLDWKPSATLSCNTCLNPVANPTETTTYILNYLYGNMCVDQRQITIERLNSVITLPNVFSPNGDGNNDVFFVQFPDKVTGIIKSFNIYDRWGNLVFSAKDKPGNSPSDGWSGDFGSQDAMEGVYVYLIEVQIDGKIGSDVYSGSITMVR